MKTFVSMLLMLMLTAPCMAVSPDTVDEYRLRYKINQQRKAIQKHVAEGEYLYEKLTDEGERDKAAKVLERVTQLLSASTDLAKPPPPTVKTYKEWDAEALDAIMDAATLQAERVMW